MSTNAATAVGNEGRNNSNGFIMMQDDNSNNNNNNSNNGTNNSTSYAIEGMDDAVREMEAAEKADVDQLTEEELSFYSAGTNEHGDDNIWGLLSGVGGNIFEWYDFAVYGLLAPEIGSCFFPKSSKELQLINSFGVYLAAFLMRPLGAILFGEMGDRLVGRKNALVYSIVLITIPTVCLGLLPSYHVWGPAAPICLVILRMIQGLSVGGQLAGSYVLSIEQSSPKSRGFRGSVCDASSSGGFLLASAVTTVTRTIFTNEQVNTWAWRVPFLFSLLLAPLLYNIVKNTEESKFWSEKAEEKEAEHFIQDAEETGNPAIVDLFSTPFRRRQLAGMIGVISATASSFYILFMWTPVYLSELRGVMAENEADLLNFCVVGCYIFLLLFSGRLSDEFPHRMDLIRIGLPGIIIGCPTMLGLFESESYLGYFFGQLQFAFCLSLVQGSIAAWKVELWMADPTLSYTAVAIGHNFGATIFGGTLPLIATYLYYRSLDLVYAAQDRADDEYLEPLLPRLIPGFYVSFWACVALYCISIVIRHPHDVRTGGSHLRKKVEQENRKIKAKQKAKAKRKKQILEQQYSGNIGSISSPTASFVETSSYVPPTTSTAT